MRRRAFLRAFSAIGGAAVASSTLFGCATTASAARGRVVVVGGGYGGATAAKYIRMWSDGAIDVTLVEPDASFISCPLSNLILGGSKTLADITVSYEGLVRNHGVKLVRDTASAIDVDARVVRLASGQQLRYDRLVLSPGIDVLSDKVPSLKSAEAQAQILHAWKAGPQTVALRRQLEAMPDGGVFAISIPVAPYRCPPGPYERACQAAWYFKRAKPRSKVLILDGNGDVTSKGPLFKKAWAEEYKGIVEYRPNYVLTDVDVATKTAKFDVQDNVTADVLNVIPPQGASAIARSAGVVTANDRWCDVDFLTFESVKVKNVHVLGDAIQIATGMPKSGHMANQHAKVCAAAVVALLAGEAPDPAPVLNNTCYSFITDKDVVHVCSVHQYDREKKTLLPVQGAGGLSPQMSEVEGRYAFSWAKNIWADALA
ncbi:MAG TPA: NAD(P)/FAD-dependent oxidoreductase [Casimicrobiaceae bacterium]|nr:NAD(P)/FAD-dependent oxidoreductase [Casimicrobiaceae bacterium]